MAEIKRIVKSAPLSTFHQAAPETGGAFRFLAETMQAGYDFLLPAAKAEMQKRGENVGRDIARQQIGDPTSQVTRSTMGGNDPVAPSAPSSGNNTDWLVYDNQGATRNKPISDKLKGSMSFLADMGIKMRVFSGGQDATGPNRTGSHRHDDGGAGDVFFEKDGRKLDWNDPADQPIFSQIVKEAKARGVTGFGAGDGYMQPGSMHLGFGPSSVWGADGKGENAANWLRQAVEGNSQTTISTSGAPAGTQPDTYTAPTLLRDADGKLTSRLYSPLSGPLLQISNAAAGVAYQSDVMLKSNVDLLDMANHFLLDPEGYRQAATSYVDNLVKAAPEAFQSDIRASAENLMNQRFLGMVEERQRDIRQRADNSSRALADRYSDNLAQAVASGNPDAIASAQDQLHGILTARENLPGVAWTREQSENVIIKAQEAGAALIDRQQKQQITDGKTSLKLIADAAIEGRTAADEAKLQDPFLQQNLPDEWRQAAASVMLRDQMPSFMRMTPAEQQQALADMKDQPVQADWEMDLYGAAEKAAAANAAAWEKDPIKQAEAVLPNKPPAMPSIQDVMDNPSSLTDALAARVAYANDLKAKGFVDFTSVFSTEEAATYGALFGKETPPEIKALLAGAVVASAGRDATQVFKELKSDDPVTLHAGMLMARGGDTVIPTMAMKGQSLLDQGLVQPPSKATSLSAISPDVATAMASLPAKASGDTLKFAMAIFASQAPANGLDEEAEKSLMESSIQLALGQATNKRGELTGGVQTVGSSAVLLPPNMSGKNLNAALKSAFEADFDFGSLSPFARLDVKPDLWVSAGSGSAPMLGGQPLEMGQFEMTVLTPQGGNMYRLSLNVNGQMVDAATATGGPFIFDAAKLIEAARPPAPTYNINTAPGSISDLGAAP